MPRSKSKGRSRAVTLALVGLAVLGAIALLAATAAGGYYWLQREFQAPGPAPAPVRIQVEPGASVRAVLNQLAGQGAVRNSREVQLYLRVQGRAPRRIHCRGGHVVVGDLGPEQRPTRLDHLGQPADRGRAGSAQQRLGGRVDVDEALPLNGPITPILMLSPVSTRKAVSFPTPIASRPRRRISRSWRSLTTACSG